MARKKLKDIEKKPKIGITIDIKLDEILNKFLDENNVNRSKYIENLIRNDMKERGIEIKPDF